MEILGLLEELDVIVSMPVAEPAVCGLKVRGTDTVWPGFKVAGRLTADAEKPEPITAIEFTVTAAVPVDVSIMVCVVGLLMTTAPKGILLAFTLRVGVAAFNCRATDFEVLAVVAVKFAN